MFTGETEDIRFRGFAGMWKTRNIATDAFLKAAPPPTVRYGRRVRVRARDFSAESVKKYCSAAMQNVYASMEPTLAGWKVVGSQVLAKMNGKISNFELVSLLK